MIDRSDPNAIDRLTTFTQLVDNTEACITLMAPYADRMMGEFAGLRSGTITVDVLYANLHRDITALADTVHGALRRALADQTAAQQAHDQFDPHDQADLVRAVAEDRARDEQERAVLDTENVWGWDYLTDDEDQD